MSKRNRGMGIIGVLGFLLILLGLATLICTLIAYLLQKTIVEKGGVPSIGQWLTTLFYVYGFKKYSVIAGFVCIAVGTTMCYIDEK